MEEALLLDEDPRRTRWCCSTLHASSATWHHGAPTGRDHHVRHGHHARATATGLGPICSRLRSTVAIGEQALQREQPALAVPAPMPLARRNGVSRRFTCSTEAGSGGVHSAIRLPGDRPQRHDERVDADARWPAGSPRP